MIDFLIIIGQATLQSIIDLWPILVMIMAGVLWTNRSIAKLDKDVAILATQVSEQKHRLDNNDQGKLLLMEIMRLTKHQLHENEDETQ